MFLCVWCLEYNYLEIGERIYGVCFFYLCGMEEGVDVVIIGFVGKEMLLFDDEDVIIIMIVIGIGIVFYCVFLWWMFKERE